MNLNEFGWFEVNLNEFWWIWVNLVIWVEILMNYVEIIVNYSDFVCVQLNVGWVVSEHSTSILNYVKLRVLFRLGASSFAGRTSCIWHMFYTSGTPYFCRMTEFMLWVCFFPFVDVNMSEYMCFWSNTCTR